MKKIRNKKEYDEALELMYILNPDSQEYKDVHKLMFDYNKIIPGTVGEYALQMKMKEK